MTARAAIVTGISRALLLVGLFTLVTTFTRLIAACILAACVIATGEIGDRAWSHRLFGRRHTRRGEWREQQKNRDDDRNPVPI